MRKLGTIFVLCLGFSINGFAQNNEEIKKPDEQIIVNKEYDENGNLIAYDSTYLHTWSSDSTFNFNNNHSFSEMEAFINKFFEDSTKMNFNRPFDFSPFEDDFFKNFNFSFNDSTLFEQFNLDSTQTFQKQHFFPDLEEIQKQLEKQFPQFNFPENTFHDKLNESQKKELEELKKKHQKEVEELKKKWRKEEQ